MRLVLSSGLRNVVTRPSLRLLHKAETSRLLIRTINTRPRHERAQPVIERIDLRIQPNSQAQSIGIVGGGVTGLTTAWHLSRMIPDAKITVYDAQDRMGGWLDSEILEVDGGEVLFEWGPRTLRPDPAGAGRATIMLLLQLEMQQELIGVLKTAPAALNRFVYYGGKLVQMPGPNPKVPPFWNAIRNGYKVLTEPIFNGLLGSIFAEFWVQPRPANMVDESVGDFIRRRFGPTAADNLASALIHGIYAGDLYKLSARTILPALWHMETRDPEGGGILMEMTDIAFKGQGLMQYKHGRYMDLLEADDNQDRPSSQLMQDLYNDVSVYTFGKGLQSLNRRLEERMRAKSNIEFKPGHAVQSLNFDPKSKKLELIAARGSSKEDYKSTHDYVVTTVGPAHLSDWITSSATAREATRTTTHQPAFQAASSSATVGVVNLYFSDPDIIPPSLRGFGYLIPRTVSLDQNPERALGVIFGSETSGTRGPEVIREVPNVLKAKVLEKQKELADYIAKYSESFKELSSSSPSSPSPSSSSTDQTSTPDTDLLKLFQTELAALEKQGKSLLSEPDTFTIRTGQDSAPGTKLTIMFGGHWWDTWSPSDLPNPEDLITMSLSLLSRHLNITSPPTIAKARLNKDCIPQYHVGYRQNMAGIHNAVMQEYQGRLKCAGPWYQGAVGVNDCVMNAHVTAFNIREGWDEETGLKEYTEKEKWLVCDRRTQTFSLDRS